VKIQMKIGTAIAVMMLCTLAGCTMPAKESTPAPTQAVQPTPAAAVTASPVKTPTPGVTAIRLYAYGRELMVADGFTLYVGDKPVEITAVLEPDVPNVPVGWTFSDQEAASLDVSSDGKTIYNLSTTGKDAWLQAVMNAIYSTQTS